MNYEPNWQSKTLSFLLSKPTLCTLLDASQLMSYQLPQQQQFRNTVSKKVMVTLGIFNIAIVASSFFLSRKLSLSNSLLSVKRLAFDGILVLTGCWLGAVGMAHWLADDVRKAKAQYLLKHDMDFMLHFDILCSKYCIDERIQTQDIISEAELGPWLQDYTAKLTQLPSEPLL